MTANEFLAICLEYNILPELALENEDVKNAIKANNIPELHRILSTCQRA